MASKKCKSCGNVIGSRARQCPNCGQPQTTGIAKLGLALLLFIVVTAPFTLLNDETPTPPPQTVKSERATPPTQQPQPTEKPKRKITSFAHAKAVCPNDLKCLHEGLIADFGSICKSWVKLETDREYTASSEGLPKRVFHSSDPVTKKHHWRLLGDAFYDTRTGVRYWYGCEVNTSTGKIVGIAPPVPVGTKRRYKQFN